MAYRTIPEERWAQYRSPEREAQGVRFEDEETERIYTFWQWFDERAPEGETAEFFLWFRSLMEEVWSGSWPDWIDELRTDYDRTSAARTYRWSEPYSAQEITAYEQRAGFSFPPSYRLFLQTLGGVRTPEGIECFVSWREGAAVEDFRLDFLNGILWGAWVNYDWHERWGPYPETIDECAERLRVLLLSAPNVLPMLGHRAMIALPEGPILSIYGTDTIIYGDSLRQYLVHEFLDMDGMSNWERALTIPFWGELLSFNSYPVQDKRALLENKELVDQRIEQHEQWLARNAET